MFSFLAISAVAFLSWWLTGLFRRYALHSGVVDYPDSRSSHTSPTPSGGGVAIVLSVLAAAVGLFFYGDLSAQLCLVILVGGASVAAVGLWDDHRQVTPGLRLLVHFICVSFSLFWCGGVPEVVFVGYGVVPIPVVVILAVLALVWFLNLFNFMDGIDGIACVEVISTCVAAALLLTLFDDENVLILYALAASCFGFLLWNWPPAKIFMGDAGSGFLGFCLGAVALYYINSSSMTIWSWLILFAVFWVDATLTLFRRVWQGNSIVDAHCTHAYQILARHYSSHKKVTVGVVVINICWLLPWAYLSVRSPDLGVLCVMLAIVPLCWLSVRVEAGCTVDVQ